MPKNLEKVSPNTHIRLGGYVTIDDAKFDEKYEFNLGLVDYEFEDSSDFYVYASSKGKLKGNKIVWNELSSAIGELNGYYSNYSKIKNGPEISYYQSIKITKKDSTTFYPAEGAGFPTDTHFFVVFKTASDTNLKKVELFINNSFVDEYPLDSINTLSINQDENYRTFKYSFSALEELELDDIDFSKPRTIKEEYRKYFTDEQKYYLEEFTFNWEDNDSEEKYKEFSDVIKEIFDHKLVLEKDNKLKEISLTELMDFGSMDFGSGSIMFDALDDYQPESQEPIASKISISKKPSKTTYFTKEKLNTNGGKLEVVYSDGSKKTIDLKANMVSDYDFSGKVYGKQTATVSYEGVSTTLDLYLNRFKDVPHTNSFYDYVHELVDEDIIKGYDDGTFRPNASLTRAQAAKMIVLSAGLEYDGSAKANFKDVKSSSSLSPYIAAAQKAGILKGYDDGTFKPNEPVKRSQIAKMTSLAFDLKKSGTPEKFKDVESIKSQETRDYIYTLSSLEIVKGYGDEFRPYNSVTRGQFSKIASIAKEKSE